VKAGSKILIAGLAGVAVLAAAGALAWKNLRPANALAGQTLAQAVPRTIELIASEVYVIRPRGLVDTVRFTGTTQPVDQTIVKARVSGRLADVLVREGDTVVKDQVIARFEVQELQAKVDERESALDAARSEARFAARDLVDKETLAGRNIVSRAALDAARALAETKASMVEVSEAQLDVVRRNLADCEVRAPFDGVVGERIANQGESLPVNGRIVTLLDTRHVEVVAQMPAADVVLLKVDQPAVLQLEGFGAREFTGRIARISPSTLLGSRSIPVYVSIGDRHDALRGGLFATGTVVVQEVDRGLAVPKVAVRNDRQGDHVLAVENDTLVRKPVTVVRSWSRGELIEVEGVEAGMTIVAADLRGLKPGQVVKVLELR
jgi:RND family efflux transporter MFP subunit